MSNLNRLTYQPSPMPLIVLGGRHFSYPELFTSQGLLAALGGGPGLYAVMAYDLGWRPLPYRPLYFGESENIWSRATAEHENYSSWVREAGTATLYRAFHYMTGSTAAARRAAESALIAHYGTPCNRRLSIDLARLLRGI